MIRILSNKTATSAFIKKQNNFHGVRGMMNNRSKHTVALQLDYYMSTQFAGVACAMTNQLYEKAGIDTLTFLPICPVGLEMERVREQANTAAAATAAGSASTTVTIGSVEQNIFVPTLYQNPSLKVKAIAAMFQQSPLCLASMKSSTSGSSGDDKNQSVVGAHEDTVQLIERILKSSASSSTSFNGDVSVVASPRPTKNTDLMSGKYDFIQAYTTTEVPTLQRLAAELPSEQEIVSYPLEGMGGAKLGYSQMLFAPEEDLQENDKRELIQAFLEATFAGWELAIQDKESAVKSVQEAQRMVQLDDEGNDHWDASSDSYMVESVGLCNDLVQATYSGGSDGKYGMIDVQRWNEASQWLLEKNNLEENFGLDPTIWK